ncbi:hypothetical protein N431DRAFT_475541 [Stipitochalara longipes BDJ]|nr:hypothetical protein N431DRAFT_475541 [Stipitochalara longipes BDJ]
MADTNASTTILCCNAVQMLEHPIRPSDNEDYAPGSPSDLLSPFDFLYEQAGNPHTSFNPRVPFSSNHYYEGIIQVIEFRNDNVVGVKWYGEIALGGERSGRFVEIPHDRAERDVGGILEETGGFCRFGNCPVHDGLGFVAQWHRFDEESYGEEGERELGGEEQIGEDGIEEENDFGGEYEDEDEDMDDGEEEGESGDDNEYAELRKRVSSSKGVPCDRCSRDNTSKWRNYCSRRMLPGGAPKCDRCEDNGWECTWDTVGNRVKKRS